MQSFICCNTDRSITITLPRQAAKQARARGETFSKFHDPQWQTPYRKGLINTKKDPTLVERVGAVGEQAFHLLTGLPIDKKVRKYGNKYDFPIQVDGEKKVVEVKAQHFDPDWMFYPCLKRDHYYVKAREHPSKPLRPLESDFYAFGLVEGVDRDMVQVMFEGWIPVREMQEHMFVDKMMKGDGENYYIHKSFLRDMVEFMWRFRSSLVLADTSLFF